MAEPTLTAEADLPNDMAALKALLDGGDTVELDADTAAELSKEIATQTRVDPVNGAEKPTLSAPVADKPPDALDEEREELDAQREVDAAKAAEDAAAAKAETDAAAAKQAAQEKVAADAKAAEDAAAALKGEQAPKGVLAKDGETIIPFDVLAAERTSNKALREENERLKAAQEKPPAWVEALSRRTEPPPTPEPKPDRAAQIAQVNTQIATLEKEYDDPAITAPLKAMLGMLEGDDGGAAQQAKIDRLEAQVQGLLDGFDTAAESQTGNNIDTNPELSQWRADALAAQAGDDEKSALAWDRAVEYDDFLRTREEWRERPEAERFAHVVKVVQASDAAPPGTPKPTSQETVDKGDGTPAPAKKRDEPKPNIPGTLSDATAAGHQEDKSQTETLMDMDELKIAELMTSGKMSSAQLDTVLRGLS